MASKQQNDDPRFAEVRYLHYKKHYIVERLKKENITLEPSELPLFTPMAASSSTVFGEIPVERTSKSASKLIR